MTGETESLSATLERALHELAGQHSAEHHECLADILWANLKSGRIQRFLERGTVADVGAYVERVEARYSSSREYVHQLQNELNPAAWELLLQKLQRWAYPLLWHESLAAERQQHCFDCATDAAMVIGTSRFPYDTSFHAWARVILRNTCLRYIQARCRSSVVPDTAFVECDEQGWLHGIRDPRSGREIRRFELQQVLREVLTYLTAAQHKFIVLYYFLDLDYGEIASLVDKNRNALYKLHHDALHNLREHWRDAVE